MILKLPVRDLFVNFKCIASFNKNQHDSKCLQESCRLLQRDFLTTQHGSKLPSHIFCTIFFINPGMEYTYTFTYKECTSQYLCSITFHVKFVDFVDLSQRWDEVSIEEETEDGKKISSKIRVPMQVAMFGHSGQFQLLYV